MSDITPKPVAGGSGVMPTMPVTSAAAPPATATAAEIPAAVANLSVGSFITGTVIERGPRGLVVLRTDKGAIKLQSPMPLKQGSTVILQIQSVGTQVQFSILSIDGHPLAGPNAKVLPATARPESAVKTPAASGAPTRASSPLAGGTPSQSRIETSVTTDSTGLRPASGDRAALPRTAAGTPTTNPAPAPAPTFVARPLLGTNVSAGIETSSPQQPAATSPGANIQSAARQGAMAPMTTTGATAPMTATGAPLATNMFTAGAPIAATIVNTPPATGMAAVADSPANRTGATGTPAIPLLIPSPGAALSRTAQVTSSDQVVLRLLGVELPSAAPTAGAPSGVAVRPPVPGGQAQAIVGTIVEAGQSAKAPSMTAPGAAPKTLINTPLGTFAVDGTPPGPAGTKLLLELLPRADGATMARPDLPSALASTPTVRGQEWPLLRDIMTAIRTADAGAADHLTNMILPRVGPNLATGLLAFVGALRQGNPRAWLGENTVDMLQRHGHGALIDKLTDEFVALTRLAADTTPNGWQTLLVPLFDGERIQQIRMYLRRPRRKPGAQAGTRFMIEAELTKLGLLQLDGLINKPQFDLAVRTRTALPPAIRGDIIEIFSDALLATQLKGIVIFQITADLQPGPPASDGDAGIGLIV